MAEHQRANQENQADVERKHRAGQKESRSSFDTFQAREEGLTPSNETPFNPRMDEHAATLSMIPFSTQRHEFVMRLNNTYGYRYIQRLMKSMDVQAKLTVSDPNDIYEQEADRVAEMVTRTINTPVRRQAPEEEEELQMQTTVKEVGRKNHSVYRQSEEEEELLQSKTNVRRQAPEEEEELQTQPDESTVTTVASDIETRINSARSGGQPLSDDVQGKMEGAFGADFENVRVHTDPEADKLNTELNAKAFTTGSDIFFRENEYSPESDSGKKLIAHELTHVIQQTGQMAQQTGENDPNATRGKKVSTKKSGFNEQRGNEAQGQLDSRVILQNANVVLAANSGTQVKVVQMMPDVVEQTVGKSIRMNSWGARDLKIESISTGGVASCVVLAMWCNQLHVGIIAHFGSLAENKSQGEVIAEVDNGLNQIKDKIEENGWQVRGWEGVVFTGITDKHRAYAISNLRLQEILSIVRWAKHIGPNSGIELTWNKNKITYTLAPPVVPAKRVRSPYY